MERETNSRRNSSQKEANERITDELETIHHVIAAKKRLSRDRDRILSPFRGAYLQRDRL